MPHAGDCLDAKVPQAAQRFNAPMRSAVCSGHKGTLPSARSFIELDNDRFIVTCVKKAEYNDAIVLRGYNPTSEMLSVNVSLPYPVQSVKKIMLEELEGEGLEVQDGNTFGMEVMAGEIYSCAIHLKTSV